MSEANFWQLVRGHLQPFGVMKRVENRLDLGTPDTAYCLRMRRCPPVSGWVELKYLDRWPVDAGTPVTIDHLTLDQVMWMEAWAKGGGRAWLVAQVGTDVVMCGPPVARLLHGKELNTALLRGMSALCKPLSPFPVRAMLEVLTG